MTSIPAAITAQMALVQQNFAMSMIKQTAQMQQSVVAILESAAESVPVSSSRGGIVDISV